MHPPETQLALFAGDDLRGFERWRIRRHLNQCQQCSRDVQALRSLREEVRQVSQELPDHLNWARLSGEITGNIRVGLAAGEAIARFDRPAAKSVKSHSLGWNAAMVLSGATVVVMAVLWVKLPQSDLDHLRSAWQRIRYERIGSVVRIPGITQPAAQDGVTIEAGPSGIEVKQNGNSMSLLHRSSEAAVTVSMQDSAGARYIDSDTGQATMTKVYYAP